jgi:predicted alpha/beta hydrolase family esterase
MPRRPSRSVPTVLLAGPVGEQDWPRWLAGQLSAADRQVRCCFLTATEPPGAQAQLTAAQVQLADALAGLPDDGFDLVAHSIGCLLWLHRAASGTTSPRPARVALVAPPAGATADWAGLLPVPLDIDAVRKAADGTVLVGSDNDPACPAGVAQQYGAPLKMATTVVPGAGGFTAADGYGPWPAVLDWCGRDNLAFLA